MSDTLVVRFNEESKQSDLNLNAEEDEDDDILDKLGIPALSEIDTAQKDRSDENESKNKFKRSLNKVFKEALEVIKSIKNKEFSRDPDFLELQIMKAEKKLNEFSKVIWEKLDLTCYKDPSDYYTMIRMAKAVFSRDLKDLMEKEKNIKNHELSKDIFELYTEKFITEGKLIDIKDKLDNSRELLFPNSNQSKASRYRTLEQIEVLMKQFASEFTNMAREVEQSAQEIDLKTPKSK